MKPIPRDYRPPVPSDRGTRWLWAPVNAICLPCGRAPSPYIYEDHCTSHRHYMVHKALRGNLVTGRSVALRGQRSNRLRFVDFNSAPSQGRHERHISTRVARKTVRDLAVCSGSEFISIYRSDLKRLFGGKLLTTSVRIGPRALQVIVSTYRPRHSTDATPSTQHRRRLSVPALLRHCLDAVSSLNAYVVQRPRAPRFLSDMVNAAVPIYRISPSVYAPPSDPTVVLPAIIRRSVPAHA